ncbi:hypothetical protein GIB67_032971 [Kingdonia uniflora]|uniref:WAT1-related protein n=1 Tax=Kingdonia uniflora TaxID=39325 RepID=A0A7J7MYG2_9MAGN|nr:hypothetical protein GIB67_032971 [Kingdonia uniflora]
MITSEFIDVGVNVLSKTDMSRGMSPFVYVVYYHTLGTFLLFPFFILDYRIKHHPLTFSILCRFFLLNTPALAFTSITYSSPALSSVTGNLVLVLTFVLAIIFRMEKLNLRSWSSRAKSLGTIIAISGFQAATVKEYPSQTTVVFFYCFFGTI